MRVLQLCVRVPYPPRDGGSIAMYNLALSLRNSGAEVSMLALNTDKHYIDLNVLPEEFLKWSKLKAVNIDTGIKVLPAFLNLFSGGSYNISRFYSKEFEVLLHQVISNQNFDIIQMETIFFAPYIKRLKNKLRSKIVLRAHNVEHIIWERLAIEEKNPFKSAYLKFLAQRIKSEEMKLLNMLDAIVPITGNDAAYFKKHAPDLPVHVSPIGLDIEKYKHTHTENETIKLFHLGAMDWMPNIEAVDWLLKEVWPQVRHLEDVELHIAGAGMPSGFFEIDDPKLFVHGPVLDAPKFYFERDLMLVPVFSGSGMRVKIIEGFAAGRTVISTSIGAEGIPAEHGKHLIIANTADEFCKAIIELLGNRAKMKELAENARTLVKAEFDNTNIGRRLMNFYKGLIENW